MATREQLREVVGGYDIDDIMDYEQGEMDDIRTLKMFAGMIKDGSAWTLQGHYGRTAHALIEDGFIDRSGDLTDKAKEFIELNVVD